MSNIPKGYKQTEIGVMPEDWGVKLLGDVCIKIQDKNYGGNSPREAIAHVKQYLNNEWATHPLSEHLVNVAKLAHKMAAEFHGEDWAKQAGLWHDLGKNRSAFQNYIKRKSGYDAEAHTKDEQVDHSTAGALYAFTQLGEIGKVFAYLVAGHHAGLPDWFPSEVPGQSALSIRLDKGKEKKYLEEALINNIADDVLRKKELKTKPIGSYEGLHLWIRMLFSCLVDADFLDTEIFMDPEKAANRGKWPSIQSLWLLSFVGSAF